MTEQNIARRVGTASEASIKIKLILKSKQNQIINKSLGLWPGFEYVR